MEKMGHVKELYALNKMKSGKKIRPDLPDNYLVPILNNPDLIQVAVIEEEDVCKK